MMWSAWCKWWSRDLPLVLRSRPGVFLVACMSWLAGAAYVIILEVLRW